MKTLDVKTLSELSQLEGRVYIRMATPELEKKFMEQAESEGFVFVDGVKPSLREAQSFMAVNANHTLNYVGMFGRMAYSTKTSTVDGQKLYRVLFNGSSDWQLEE